MSKDKSKIIQVHVYVSENGEIDVPIVNQEAWLSQKDMAQLFDVTVQNIGQHIKSVIKDDDLGEDSTIKNIFIVAADGKKRQVMHYNLDVILPVGYRVNSKRATHFRKWTNQIIKDYLLEGIAVNESRIRKLDDETLARVSMRSISAITKAYRELGYSDDKIRSRLNGIVGRIDITAALKAYVIGRIYYGQFTNQTYVGLFRRDADQLKALNGGQAPRDGMTAEGLDFLSTAESSVARLLKERRYVRYFEALTILDRVCHELEPAIQGLQKLLGIVLGTSQSLLSGGDDIDPVA